MAGFLAKIISKKILSEKASNNFGQDDPMYEHTAEVGLDGKPTGRTIKRKKGFPPGISENDKKILNKVRRRAYRLDNAMSICGLRFGWSSIIGLFPVLGDFLDVFMAIMVYRTCMKVDGGLDDGYAQKMWFNICLDGAIGFVPILGDVADALFRANSRNAVVLERMLEKRGQRVMNGEAYVLNKKTKTRAQKPKTTAQPSIGSDTRPSGPKSTLQQPIRIETNANKQQREKECVSAQRHETSQGEHDQSRREHISRPQPATLNKHKRAGGGWLGRFVSRGDMADLETGQAAPIQPPRTRI